MCIATSKLSRVLVLGSKKRVASIFPRNMSELFFAMGANETYLVILCLIINSDPAADIKTQMVLPGGALISALWGSVNVSLTSGVGFVYKDSAVLGGGEGIDAIPMITAYVVRNGATPGNFQLQWAQYAAHVSDTTVKEGSSLVVVKAA